MKQSGSYATLLQGVSQQPPEVRQPGQHSEQVNMVPDPIKGLTRRQGSVMQAVQQLTLSVPASEYLDAARTYRVHEHQANGKDYVILIRSTPGPGPVVLCYNRTDKVWIPLRDNVDTGGAAAGIASNGVSAITSVGKFVVYARNNATLSYSNDISFQNPSRAVVWIRGGAYTRTYKVTLGDGQWFAYTTPNAGAAGAAEAISPQNIAAQLVIGAGNIGITATQNGAHITFTNAGFFFTEISVTDGGDGSLIRGVMGKVDSVDDLTLMAVQDMVVLVQPSSDSGFYVKATTKTSGLSEAIWVETAGVRQEWTGFPMMYIGGTASNPNTPYIWLGSPSQLSTQLGFSVPLPVASNAGDTISNPRPRFISYDREPVTYLGMFQDRMLVGCGAYLSVSAAGDYFNFFRTTVTTVLASDAFEMIAQGSEDDKLRHSVLYNRNLVIFGNRRQYVISGQAQLSPLSPNMSIMTTYANAAQVRPIAAGGLIYYARDRGNDVEVHQIQPGSYVDSAESFPASAQIGDYIPAAVQQIEVDPGAPSELLVRTTSSDNVYAFSYLDSQDGRKQGAWYRWSFNPTLGKLAGLVPTPEGVVLLWLRQGTDGNVYAVADLVPKAASGADLPFFDSIRPYSTVLAATTDVKAVHPSWDGAYNSDSERFLVGGNTVTDLPELLEAYPTETPYLVVGATAEAYVEPTNPQPRDGQGKVILDAQMTVTRKSINIKESAGFTAKISTINGDTEYVFNGRVLGQAVNRIGKTPLVTGANHVPIGRGFTQYRLQIAANKWYPLTLVGMDWTGQSFNRTQRANS